ncbi:hypothetical protein BGZ49_005174, partial [Haplosporangium sp. Z 27]
IVGQHHLDTLYCDITIKQMNCATIVVELVATETAKAVQAHIDKTITYMNLAEAKEGWVVHFTMEDNYLEHPLWQTNEVLQDGLNVIHIWHNKEFTDVRLSARWKTPGGQTFAIENEQIISSF